MSDTHAWPTAAAIEDAMSELRIYRDRMRELVNTFDRDDPARALAISHVLGLDALEHKMRLKLAQPAPVGAGFRPREVGENTQAWLSGQTPIMRRNRGHL